MSNPSRHEPRGARTVSPPRTGNSTTSTAASHFTDSAIDMDLPLSPITPTMSPMFKSSSPMVDPDPTSSLSAQTRSQPPSLSPSPTPPERTDRAPFTSVSLATRLAFLSNLSSSEQSTLPSESLASIHAHIDIVQSALTSSPHEPPPAPPPKQRIAREMRPLQDDPNVLSESQALLSQLTTSLSTLRVRHSETLHLHKHLTSKLTSLASSTLAQSREIGALKSQISKLEKSNVNLADVADDLSTQVIELEAREEMLETRERDLRTTNSTLQEQLQDIENENSGLKSEVAEAERAALEDEVALEAMSAAVGGLEGWVDSFAERTKFEKMKQQQTPYLLDRQTGKFLPSSIVLNQPNGRQSTPSIRGRGRFRGRYNPQSNSIGPMSPPATPSNATKTQSRNDWSTIHDRAFASNTGDLTISPTATADFEEGIRSWIKGFRDVEESIRTRIRIRGKSNHYNTATTEDNGTEQETDVFDAGDGSDDEFDEF